MIENRNRTLSKPKLQYSLAAKYINTNEEFVLQYVFPADNLLKTKNDYDIRTIQELLGHSSVKTTMIYTHVANMGAGIRSPLDG